ncbi:hypothetical protein IMZ11_39775 [Microtetraspora sp. AC03309]|uniref:DUF6609 family protein n=1 Tax=Microtetraspora sp. AC03309 TaxID=2779376 RepID=UPI001E300273|nr:DUF6609 family protein [Microtetraspora sp. AC03309]MCC5581758.1 hypothetical protein [Microtetraspora sp. AC03309]
MPSIAVAVADHPYPLIRGGGLFLLFVGLGFLGSWAFNKYWIQFLIGGFIAGFTASGLSALLPSLGSPSFAHIAGLVGSFVIEAGLIYLVLTKNKDADERTLILSIFFVVGLHFLPMGLAHGPLITILGVLTAINALVGLRLARKAPTPVFGVVDAVLKLGFGAVMLFAYPALTFS